MYRGINYNFPITYTVYSTHRILFLSVPYFRFKFFIEFSVNYTIQDYRTQCYDEALENNNYWKYERRHLIFVYIHRIVMFYLFEHHLD